MAPTHAQSILKWARYYASMGMIPMPFHGLLPSVKTPDGRLQCSCGKAKCKDPGKHPIGSGWNLLKTPQEGVNAVVVASKRDPNLNIAIVTGNSGLLVVDLDVKPNKAGEFVDGLANFIELVGGRDFPDCPHQHSGGGGHHFFFQVPIDSQLSPKNLNNGIEFKTGRSPIHVYPSRHVSGGSYRWDPPPDFRLMPPPCPEWIMEIAREESARDQIRGEQAITITPEELKKLAKKWAASTAKGAKPRNGLILKALLGFELARPETLELIRQMIPAGRGHDTFLGLTGALADSHTTIKAEYVLEALKPAIDWRASAGGSTTFDELVAQLRADQTKHLASKQKAVAHLITSEGNKLQSCTSNTYLLLRHHRDWDDVLAFDVRSMCTVFLKQPPHTELAIDRFPHQVDDRDVVMISQWFARQQGAISKAMIGDVIDAAAYGRQQIDPVLDYYESLQWDGISRLDHWLTDYAGVEDSTYTQRVGATYLISAVARTYLPGCKVDHVLVFEGAQGFQKSTLLESLVPNADWISDSKIDLDSKDGKMMLTGRLFIELAELSSIKRATVELVKNFITGKVDDYRPPYERKVTRVPRRSVFAASTNEQHYLVDDTGDRRFWPVLCGATDLAKVADLIENRDQIWAEAVHRFQTAPENPDRLAQQTGGEIWWLTKDEEELARFEQEKRSEAHDDPWLGEFLDDWSNHFVPGAAPEGGKDAFASVDDPSKRMQLHDGHFAYTHELLKLRGERLVTPTSKRLARVAKLLRWTPTKDSAGVRGYSLPASAPARILPTRAELRLVPAVSAAAQ